MLLQLVLLLVGIWAVFLLPSLWSKHRDSALYTTAEYYHHNREMDRVLTSNRANPALLAQQKARREQIRSRRRSVLAVLGIATLMFVAAGLLASSRGIILLGLPLYFALFTYLYALYRLSTRRIATEPLLAQPHMLLPMDVESLEIKRRAGPVEYLPAEQVPAVQYAGYGPGDTRELSTY